MKIAYTIILLCICQAIHCLHVKKDGDNDGEMVHEKKGKSKKHGATKKDNDENKEFDLADQKKYLDTLIKQTINDVSATDGMTEQQKERFSTNLSKKYEQFLEALKEAEAINNISKPYIDRNENSNENPGCNGENCLENDTLSDNNRPMHNGQFGQMGLLKHTALRHLHPIAKTIEIQKRQTSNHSKINVDSEQRADGIYIQAIIPSKVLNETNLEETLTEVINNMKSQIISFGYASNVTGKKEIENSHNAINKSQSFNATIPGSVPMITIVSAVPIVPADWWNSIWFWIIHILVLILFLILILACCMWFCGSNRRRDYNRI